MRALSVAARRWLARQAVDGAQVAVIDGGIAYARRTAVTHHVADAAEITVGDDSTLAARWLCGGQSVDAVSLPDGERIDCVNCRLAAALAQGPCVYYAWDGDGELLYVGSSINVSQRIRNHMSQTQWWPEVRRVTADEYPNELEARRAEAAAIAERPGLHNREGRRPMPGREIAELGFIVGDLG